MSPYWRRRSEALTDCMLLDTVYRKSQRHYQKTARMNKLNKVSGYKVNAEESVVFLYIKNGRLEKLRKQPHLPSHQKE